MKDAKIAEVLQEMLPYLDNSQMEQLQRVLQHTFGTAPWKKSRTGSRPNRHQIWLICFSLQSVWKVVLKRR